MPIPDSLPEPDDGSGLLRLPAPASAMMEEPLGRVATSVYVGTAGVGSCPDALSMRSTSPYWRRSRSGCPGPVDGVERVERRRSSAETRETNMVLAGVITGTIKFLILFGVVIGIVIAVVVVKLLGGRK